MSWHFERRFDTRAFLGVAGGDGRRSATHLIKLLGPVEARRAAAAIMARDVWTLDFEREGARWVTDLGDEIGLSLYASGGYETEDIEAVLAWLVAHGRTGAVVDLGANVGTTTVPFGHARFDVVAVEAVPATFEMLRTNVDRHGLVERVTLVNAAVVAAATDRVEMWTGRGSGQAEVVVEGRDPALRRYGPATGRVTVSGVTLDEVAPKEVALVWSDVQGCEAAVIQTGGRLWEAGTPLFLEVEPEALEIHGGVATFLELVCEWFGLFSTDNLVNARPIAEFSEWVRGINGRANALLHHQPASSRS